MLPGEGSDRLRVGVGAAGLGGRRSESSGGDVRGGGELGDRVVAAGLDGHRSQGRVVVGQCRPGPRQSLLGGDDRRLGGVLLLAGDGAVGGKRRVRVLRTAADRAGRAVVQPRGQLGCHAVEPGLPQREPPVPRAVRVVGAVADEVCQRGATSCELVAAPPRGEPRSCELRCRHQAGNGACRGDARVAGRLQLRPARRRLVEPGGELAGGRVQRDDLLLERVGETGDAVSLVLVAGQRLQTDGLVAGAPGEGRDLRR